MKRTIGFPELSYYVYFSIKGNFEGKYVRDSCKEFVIYSLNGKEFAILGSSTDKIAYTRVFDGSYTFCNVIPMEGIGKLG